MLGHLNILVIGGDERYVEVINNLSQKGATVYLAGYNNLTDPIDGIQLKLEDVNFKKMNAILLPVSGTDDQGKVKLAPYSDEELILTKDILQKTPENCTVYTGLANEYLKTLTMQTDKQLTTLFTRDDMAILNSIPTAEGTLNLAMAETKTMIHGTNVLVLGFGRVGMTVAQLFAAVGAHVTVCARKAAVLARVKEMGMQSIFLDELKEAANQHTIIINTIPTLTLNEECLDAVSSSALIIDLASAPGGVDFKAAKKRNIKTIHALGLPGKVAPKSAGKIIADVLIPLLK